MIVVMLLALALLPAFAMPMVQVPEPQQVTELCAYSIWYRPTCDRHADFTR
jgi:hypothetical protein